MSLYEKILSALQSRFIKCNDVARILSLAVQSGKNVLLWGPGGHGKSEMVTKALSEIEDEENIFVQSFGEGMDEATLWGGLDFAKLEREKKLEYHPENSFLAKKLAVFEEVFDAPASVLLALKDTLTSKKLRKGNQKFQMETKVIIAITNKNPEEISDLGPASHALVERFPLQLKVDWDSYKSADYLELFKKVSPFLGGADLNGSMGVLAELIAKAGEVDQPISPRSAVHALGVVKSAAELRGVNKVSKEDLIDLKFIDGFENLVKDIQSELDAAYERAAAEGRLVAAENKLQSLLVEFDQANSPIKYLQVAKRFLAFQDEVSKLKVTDGLTNRRKNLRNTASEKASQAQTRALENTRI